MIKKSTFALFAIKIFLVKIERDIHKIVAHEGRKESRMRDYKCELCDREYFYQRQLMEHKKSMHKGEKDYECDNCGKSFALPQHLRIHIKTNHEGLQNHICLACGQTFNYPEVLGDTLKVSMMNQKTRNVFIVAKLLNFEEIFQCISREFIF